LGEPKRSLPSEKRSGRIKIDGIKSDAEYLHFQSRQSHLYKNQRVDGSNPSVGSVYCLTRGGKPSPFGEDFTLKLQKIEPNGHG